MKTEQIAPCGMNCSLCSAYQRSLKKCPGCRGDDASKPSYCLSCIIKNCQFFASGQHQYCFDCSKFPCQRLKNLDKRYRTKYHMSMIDNLLFIKEKGIETFLETEKEKWTCPQCLGLICVHKAKCINCGLDK